MLSPRYDEAPRLQGYATYSPPVDTRPVEKSAVSFTKVV